MRPRFMNRGSNREAIISLAEHLASMRPRFMNRGSGALAEVGDVSQDGFNEAPIHESGKCCTIGSGVDLGRGLQ